MTSRCKLLVRCALLMAACCAGGMPIAGQEPELVSPVADPARDDGAAFSPPAARPPQGGLPVIDGGPSPYVAPPVYTAPPVYEQPPYYVSPGSPPVVAAPYELAERFWLRTEFLVWWSQPAPVPSPLVTLGSSADAIPGALGQPGTEILYGGNSVGLPAAGGIKLDFGFWLDPNQQFAVEFGFLGLGRVTRDYSAFSDANGDPVIARPTINAPTMTEGSYLDAYPGTISGGVDVTQTSQLQGFNVLFSRKLFQDERLRWEGSVGVRFLNLTESLELQDQFSGLTPGALTFVGVPISTFYDLSSYDYFRTSNNFVGGQLGTRLTWAPDRWVLSGGLNVSLGGNAQQAKVYGDTTLTAPSGASTVAAGGVLATTANMGTYNQAVFAAATEADLNVGFRLTPYMTLRVGYSFLWLSSVARPGNQVNRIVSPNLVPSDVSYGQPGPHLPAFQFHTSSFWAQGMNIGFDWRF